MFELYLELLDIEDLNLDGAHSYAKKLVNWSGISIAKRQNEQCADNDRMQIKDLTARSCAECAGAEILSRTSNKITGTERKQNGAERDFSIQM
jgi:hypothetical protein